MIRTRFCYDGLFNNRITEVRFRKLSFLKKETDNITKNFIINFLQKEIYLNLNNLCIETFNRNFIKSFHIKLLKAVNKKFRIDKINNFYYYFIDSMAKNLNIFEITEEEVEKVIIIKLLHTLSKIKEKIIPIINNTLKSGSEYIFINLTKLFVDFETLIDFFLFKLNRNLLNISPIVTNYANVFLKDTKWVSLSFKEFKETFFKSKLFTFFSFFLFKINYKSFIKKNKTSNLKEKIDFFS